MKPRKYTFKERDKPTGKPSYFDRPLTPRQIEAAALVRQLGGIQQAADALGVSYGTVWKLYQNALVKERAAGRKDGV